MERKNIWNLYSDEQISELKEINDKYKRCLDAGKTERECVELSVNMARDAGYRDLEEILRSGETLKAGDKVYAVNMNKMLALFRIGERPISEGMNILGAHIDSPRIDVKQNPLYENEELAYLDTHYYGGIKKYQWVAQPLALHGVIVKKNGETVKVSIGEDENDPVFVISGTVGKESVAGDRRREIRSFDRKPSDRESGRSQERRKRRCKTKCAQYFKRDVRYR